MKTICKHKSHWSNICSPWLSSLMSLRTCDWARLLHFNSHPNPLHLESSPRSTRIYVFLQVCRMLYGLYFFSIWISYQLQTDYQWLECLWSRAAPCEYERSGFWNCSPFRLSSWLHTHNLIHSGIAAVETTPRHLTQRPVRQDFHCSPSHVFPVSLLSPRARYSNRTYSNLQPCPKVYNDGRWTVCDLQIRHSHLLAIVFHANVDNKVVRNTFKKDLESMSLTRCFTDHKTFRMFPHSASLQPFGHSCLSKVW